MPCTDHEVLLVSLGAEFELEPVLVFRLLGSVGHDGLDGVPHGVFAQISGDLEGPRTEEGELGVLVDI
jgi:hypothetical protein